MDDDDDIEDEPEEEPEECPDCDGNGAVGGVPCKTCDGFGYIE